MVSQILISSILLLLFYTCEMVIMDTIVSSLPTGHSVQVTGSRRLKAPVRNYEENQDYPEDILDDDTSGRWGKDDNLAEISSSTEKISHEFHPSTWTPIIVFLLFALVCSAIATPAIIVGTMNGSLKGVLSYFKYDKPNHPVISKECNIDYPEKVVSKNIYYNYHMDEPVEV